ncbi:PQQ-dependent sugar dehydrogenase [Marinivivus vitaminiproducens]|uniref:PQQ-dependent sugar dehydrogenase n=1 Tax=Marinivivus vitaminiproducens TaxID=3035935 RepID=UPI00279C7598|nr:PQQ-dependent sugar dehydrogenase [Geminicoccaceae bacterium SCSIO 64248]
MATTPVGPDPLPDPIERSGLEVGIGRFETLPPSAVTSSVLARANTLFHANDGSGRLYTNDTRGPIWLIENGVVDPDPVLDLRDVRGDALIAGQSEQGLRSFAFHPDFDRPGTDGYRKFYTMSTETVGSADPGTPVLESKPGRAPMMHDVLAEWSMDPNDPSAVDVASRREVLRIAEPYENHNSDQILFNPHSQPGDSLYGAMYIGTGDGGAGGDPLGHAQDLGYAQGKILRIDPLLQANGDSYGVPSSNPFAGDPDALDEIYAYGLRHPENISFDTDTNRFLVSDIGQGNIEEINLNLRGGNYGWPEREGTFAVADNGELTTLPDDDASFGYTYPVAQYDHDEGIAVTGGFVYRGDAIPELQGEYLFGDIANGRIFHVPYDELQLGDQVEVEELTLVANGQEVTMQDLVGRERVDLRFGQGEDGELYVMSKQDGGVRKLGPIEGRTIRADGGEDAINGTNADDRIFGSASGDTVNALAGDDYVKGGNGRDEVRGGADDDRLLGQTGDDILLGGADDDALFGDAGRDNLYGGSGDDGIEGGAGEDRLEGGDGRDVLFGGADDDVLVGDAGPDRLKGGDGDDLLVGGTGDDRLTGGSGSDRFVWNASSAGDTTIYDFTAGDDHLQLTGARGSDDAAITSFDDLDTSVADGDLTVAFQDGSFLLEGVTALDPDDVLIA